MSETAVVPPPASPTMAEPIASVNGRKRRQSDADDGTEQESNTTKRQRKSPGKSPPATAAAEESASQAGNQDTPAETESESTKQPEQQQQQQEQQSQPARRKTAITDEKQRNRRLFGALLGNLQRPTLDRTSKKRVDIEERRKAELRRQDDERVEDKQRRLERLAEKRRQVQEKVDEENMRIRHAQMLSAAEFLQTSTKPKLYYRPWELRPDEEDRIDQQIEEAKAQIAKELAEFERQRDGAGPSPPRATNNQSNVDAHSGTEVTKATDVPPPIDSLKAASEAKIGPQDKSTDDEATNNGAPPPSEVPESNATNASDAHRVNGDKTDAHEGAKEEVPAEPEKAASPDYEAEHVAGGEEDTVIY